MKAIFFLFAIILAVQIKSISQDVVTTIIYDANKNEAYETLLIEKGVIKIKEFPDKMIIKKFDPLKKELYITFDKDGKPFVLSTGKTGKDTIQIIDYIKLNDVTLGFYNNALISINDSSIKPRPITSKEIKIEFKEITKEEKKETGDAYSKLTTTLQQTIITTDSALINKYLQCLLCKCSFDSCNDEKCRDKFSCNIQVAHDTSSATYKVVINVSTGDVGWYKNGIQVKDEDVHPKAYADIKVEVIADKETDIGIETNEKQYFVDSIIVSKISGTLDAMVSASTGDVLNESDIQNDAQISKGNKDSIQNCCTNLQTELLELKKNFDKESDAVKKRIEEIEKQIQAALKKSSDNVIDLKSKLLAIDIALEQFNAEFREINFKEELYYKKLTLLKIAIKECLGFPGTMSGKDFARILINSILASVPENNWVEFTNLIKAIESEFDLAVNKKTSKFKYGFTIQVPNADGINFKILNNKNKKNIYEHDFLVKGGFKIDFSTAILFTGLGVSSLDLYNTKFLFRQTKDSSFVRNGQIFDTSFPTGRIVDTSATFIRADNSKLNYGVGFFAHGYWRTGTSFNIGIATGLAFNNEGQILGLLGLSPMFNVGNNRISLLGGIAVGKTSQISNVEKDYVWKDDYMKFENGNEIFPSQRNLPRFYPGSNSSDIKVVNKWGVSYFFGLAFNFASVTPKKNTN